MNMLNCDSRLKAEKATFHKLVCSNGRFHRPPISYKDMQAIVDELLEAHKPLREHFFSVTGKTLQRVDSNIMADIQKKFVQMGIPVLCIHDSCIVQEEHEGLLHDVMSEVYKNHLAFSPIIK